MATGNNSPGGNLPFKKEFHLKTDRPEDEERARSIVFMDLSRNRLQALRTVDSLRATELISFSFPHSKNTRRWYDQMDSVLGCADLEAFMQDSDATYSVSTSDSVLVPESVYQAEHQLDLFTFSRPLPDGSAIIEQPLPKLRAMGLFAVPEKLKERLNGQITSSHLTWLAGFTDSASKPTAALVLVQGGFTLAVAENRLLQLSNWFKTSSAEDVLYYLMAALENLGIIHTEMDINLLGEVSKDDEVYRMIKKYMPRIVFPGLPSTLEYSYSFNELEGHRFPFILNAACA